MSGRVFCAGLGELEIQKARHWIACGQATCMPLLFHCCAEVSCSSATVGCGKSWYLIPCLPFLSKLLTVIGLVKFETYLHRYASSEKAKSLLKHLWTCSCKLLGLSAWTLRQFLCVCCIKTFLKIQLTDFAGDPVTSALVFVNLLSLQSAAENKSLRQV